MTEIFSERLYRLAEPLWQAQHQHPFVRGIGDGTLALERFAYWVRQDYLFLIDYARLFTVAAARTLNLELMTRFVDLAHATLHTEMELHRRYAAQFGILREELERERPAPATAAYVNFLLRTATLGSFGELVAALLPCMWGFYDVGLRLAAQPAPTDTRYAEWIAMYSSAEFGELTQWCREVVDLTAVDVSEAERQRMEEAFLASSRYELQFWEAAWQQEQWTI